MPDPKLLSGEELVAKGVTRTEGALPVVGLKDVAPNGSWLEQKQIQVALEARKHLIEANRIEKQGSLSYAEWRNDLRLAEVIKQTGGYWQYYGHHEDKKLYLRPEEALFLLESNCLQLKNNGIIMSIQEAYSILLNDELSILQYQLYASLSRLGCKVYKHVKEKIGKPENTTSNLNSSESKMDVESNEVSETTKKDLIETEKSVEIIDSNEKVEDDVTMQVDVSNDVKENNNLPIVDRHIENVSQSNVIKENNDSDVNVKDSETDTNKVSDTNIEMATETTSKANVAPNINEIKVRKLLNRKLKPTLAVTLVKNFEQVPDMYQTRYVAANVPDDQYIPKNIYVNQTSYTLNIENIKSKDNTNTSNDISYTLSDEPNNLLKKIGNGSRNDTPTTNFYPNMNNPRMPNQRPFFCFRPRNNFNYFHFNMFFQRPFHRYFNPQFQYNPRPHPFNRTFHGFNRFEPTFYNVQNRPPIKRPQKSRAYHLKIIKNLASRLKRLESEGNIQLSHIQSIQKIIQTYNINYQCQLNLTDNFDLIDETAVVETIELDTEEEPQRKRQKVTTEDTFANNFNKLQELALKLRDLDDLDQVTSRHRRSFSNAIKTFNKSFNADIYMNNNFEIINRRQIILDSDSEEETNKSSPFTKKLKNPFSMMKHFAETQDLAMNVDDSNLNSVDESNAKEKLSLERKELYKHWYPGDDDFGKPELVTQGANALTNDIFNDGFIYSFLAQYPNKFKNWLEVKIEFLKYIEMSNKQFQNRIIPMSSDSSLQPLVKPGEFSKMSELMNHLQIIKSDTHIPEVTSLKVNFDVYNKNIKNFRKSHKPRPDFRLCCISESSSLPSTAEVSTLLSKYEDDVPTVFAVVGLGTISYVQMKPIVMPVYLPNE